MKTKKGRVRLPFFFLISAIIVNLLYSYIIGAFQAMPDDIKIIDTSPQEPKKNKLELAYEAWKQNPTQANLSRVLDSAQPVIDSGLKSYAGRMASTVQIRAKVLALNAIKNYDANRGASLKSYIMLNLRPLTRYAQQ